MNSRLKKATDNKIAFEVKKDAMRQRQNGDWVLSLTLQPIDMHPTITAAKMGTRYWISLIEIDDNEEPVDHVAKERDKWRDLGPVRQAGIRCKDPVFWAFLQETGLNNIKYHPIIHDEESAARLVREYCGVATRADLDKPGRSNARIKWYELDNAFQAWKAVEHA